MTDPQHHSGDHADALVIGEALIDAFTDLSGQVTELPGGSPMNVAIGLARLGHRAELAAWIGRDERGDRIRAHLAADGVPLTAGSDGAQRTPVAMATLAQDGQATYEFDLTWDPAPIVPTRPPQIIHTGSLGALLDPGGEVVVEALEGFAGQAAISYDPNARPALMGQPADALRRVEAIITLADLVKVSDEDVAWLVEDEGVDALERTLRRWLDLGPGLVVVTRGGRGATALTRDGVRVDVPPESVTVADTIGAGDSFMAGLDDGLWRAGLLATASAAQSRPADALAAADAQTLEYVLRRCARIAGITVSRSGANPPRVEELGDLAAVPAAR